MMDDNCIFCKLANGVFPVNSIYEDEQFNVILDNAPVTKGHALILPKQHYKNIYEIPEKTASDAFVLAKKLTEYMTDKLNADGFNLLQNNNEAAGQSVPHFHLHLIPRYEGDGRNIDFGRSEATAEELTEVKNLLKQ